MTTPSVGAPVLTATGLVMRFGGQAAVDGVDLTLRRGEIHALVGENGAGKSTLCRLLAGVMRPDAGTLTLDGEPVSFASPAEAIAAGISMIAQEVALVPALTVRENVFLGREPRRWGVVDTRRLAAEYARLDRAVEFGVPGRSVVGRLPFSDQQKVEVLRALARESRVIILDEPTAALGPGDAELLMRVLRTLRDAGTTIVYISHHLQEVLDLADRVTIMRDGAIVRTSDIAQENEASLVEGMLGRSLDSVFPPRPPMPAPTGSPALSVRALHRTGAFGPLDLDVHGGEIVGITGLVGAGRSEFLRAVFGADRPDGGQVALAGRGVRIRTPRAARRAGVAMIPESRRDQGLILGLSVADNLTLATTDHDQRIGVVRRRQVRRAAMELIGRLGIRPARPDRPVGLLSGGNQQKVLFGKWLRAQPRVFLIDEPTRGVDVGARRGIYDTIVALASRGVAVVVVSSEIEEVLGLCHRVIVMAGGRITGEFSEADATEQAIMTAAFAVTGYERGTADG